MSYIAIISDYKGYARDVHTRLFPDLYPRDVAEFETLQEAQAAYPSALIKEKSEYITYISGLTAQFSSSENTYKYKIANIQQRKEYAQDLMERIKEKNISSNVNALQAMWVHQRMRALPVNFMGMSFTIDLMNLVISGDIEVACLCLMNTAADDMSLPYHWLSQSWLNWIIADMKSYLGWP